MKDDHDREDPAVTRAFMAAFGALALGFGFIVGGAISAFNASAADVQSIAGGWTAIGTGFIIGTVGSFAAFDHAMIMRRNQRHHEAVMAVLTDVLAAIHPVDEVDQRRQGNG